MVYGTFLVIAYSPLDLSNICNGATLHVTFSGLLFLRWYDKDFFLQNNINGACPLSIENRTIPLYINTAF